MARSALKNIMAIIDAEKEELPIEQAFLSDLERSIEIDDKKYARQPSKTYKPSGMNCIRQSYYVITGADGDEYDAQSTRIGICESGSDRHERIQRAVMHMRENGMDCEYINVAEFVRMRGLTDKLEIVSEADMVEVFETKLYHKTLNMSFLCDGIIKYKNHYYILEIKTESSYKFMNRKDVDPAHHHQATAYSIAFGIDEVIFLYECRDNCSKRAFMFTVTDDMKHELLDYIETCDSYIKKHKTPPKPDNLNKYTCSYCGFKKQCGIDD